MDYEVTEKGLLITASNDDRHDLKNAYESGGYYYAECLVANAIGGNGLDFIRPEMIGALTDQPLICDYVVNDDDTVEVCGPIYGYPNYMLYDSFEELKNTGKVLFPVVA